MVFGNVNKSFGLPRSSTFYGRRLQWNVDPELGRIGVIAFTRRLVLCAHFPKLWQSELYWFW